MTFRLFFIICLAVSVLAGGRGAVAKDVALLTLHRGNGAEPDTLDPQKAALVSESTIIRDLFTGLTAIDANGRLIPGAAQSWDVSEDGKRYLFRIRQDMVWSDGVPVTADDFVFSFRRLLDPMTAAEYATILYILENGEDVNLGRKPPEALGVTALGPKTLEVRLHTAVPYLLEMFSHASTYPAPRHVVEQYGKDWVKPGRMVSNGAFMLADWEPQNFVRLVANPKFYDASSVTLETVFYYPTSDDSSAVKQFRAGELDINTSFPARQYEWLEKNLPGEARIHPWLGVYYYAFNSERPPLADRRVRLALSMTIPRENIAEKLLGYGVVPAYSFVPPGVENYADFKTIDTAAPFSHLTPEERRIEARRLLAEAGYGDKNPLEVTISYNTSKDHKKIALAVAWGWKQIGVVTRLLNMEAKVHYNNLKVADFEVARAGWIADFSDAQNFLFLLESGTGQLNYGQFSNAAFDDLMRRAGQTLDLKARADLMARAERIAMAEQPVAPIYFYVSRNLVAPWVEGFKDNARNVHPSRYMSIDGPRRR